MQPEASRRSILTALAATPIALTVPAALAVEQQGSEVETLWRRYLAAQEGRRRSWAAYQAALDRLPWWAAPGPTSVGFDGTFSGPVSHWPAKRDHRLPTEPGRYVRIRIDAQNIERDCRNHVGFKDPAELAALRTRLLAELDQRLAEQQAEHQRLGIPDLDKADDVAADALFACEDAILALEPASPAVIAAQVMVTALCASQVDATPSTSRVLGIAALALRGLLPNLTGEIAADAAEIASNPERPIGRMRIWTGRPVGGHADA